MENIANIVRSALSDVPTELEEEIAKLTASDVKLPKTPKRNILDRIFVNRDLRLDRIKWIGFDMDYTLAVYNSPQYESLSYDLMITRLVEMGYPRSITNLRYDPTFGARGLLFDTQLGHLLKIDTFGNILLCVHGRQQVGKKEIATLYPSCNIPTPEIGKRFHPLPSLFNLPEACLYADLIEFFEHKSDTGMFQMDDMDGETSPRNPIQLTVSQSPVKPHNLGENNNQGFKLSYINLFQDVRAAMDHVHLNGALKEATLKDMGKYIRKSPKTAVLFDRFRKSGIKLFLLTNSEYFYTNQVMSYLLNNQNPEYKSWTDYFDVIIVSAGKPTFFGQGTTLREVDLETGHLKIGVTDKFLKGRVYSGGSIALFDRMTGAKGNQVLYIGDHIFADIIKSKKIHAWRNLLVIPELERELRIWEQNRHLYNQLHNLEFAKAEIFRNLTSEATQPPNISNLRKQIKDTIEQINHAYNPYFGSLFSIGSKHTMFSMQMARYADLYTYDYLNLLNYPLFYHFSATYYTLPHQYSDPQ